MVEQYGHFLSSLKMAIICTNSRMEQGTMKMYRRNVAMVSGLIVLYLLLATILKLMLLALGHAVFAQPQIKVGEQLFLRMMNGNSSCPTWN